MVLEMDPAVLARQPGLFGRRAEVGPGIGLAGTPGWVAVRGSTLELPAGMVTLSSKLPRPVKPVRTSAAAPEKVEWPEAYSANGGAG